MSAGFRPWPFSAEVVMFDLKLTKAQEQLLREQAIDQNGPGTILRDTAAVLDFVGPTGVRSTGKYNLLPIDSLPELDRRLSRPLRVPWERPQLRSHPYLQGIHLVLRSVGLLQVAGSGEKARLVVPEALRGQWQQLNPTEQYFTLLEAWLVFSRAEMVGERESRFDGCLSNVFVAWHQLPADGLKVQKSPLGRFYMPNMYGELYNLALMDLFGLVRVEHRAKPVLPWEPAGVGHVPFGDALFTLLSPQVFGRLHRGEEEEEVFGFGQWQALIQPYFPQWQTIWVLSADELREGIYVFRLSLGKSVWRLLTIDSRDTLDDLMGCILQSIISTPTTCTNSRIAIASAPWCGPSARRVTAKWRPTRCRSATCPWNRARA
jgi:hypothetical protein